MSGSSRMARTGSASSNSNSNNPTTARGHAGSGAAGKRSHSSANLLARNTSMPHLVHAATAAEGGDPSQHTAAAARKRHPSQDEGPGGATIDAVGHQHYHAAAKVGPKRRSKVALAGLHGHHAVHHHRRDAKNRSHASLANLAAAVAAAGASAEHNLARDGSSSNLHVRGGTGVGNGKTGGSGNAASVAMDRNRSRDHATTAPPGRNAAPAEVDPDGDAGWVSAASSKTGSPELGDGNGMGRIGVGHSEVPPSSPSSFQPLEFGKKPRRRQNRPPPQTAGGGGGGGGGDAGDHGDGYLSNIQSEATTPTRQSPLSLAGPSGLAMQAAQNAATAHKQEQVHGHAAVPLKLDDVTPTQEISEPDPPTPRLPPSASKGHQEEQSNPPTGVQQPAGDARQGRQQQRSTEDKENVEGSEGAAAEIRGKDEPAPLSQMHRPVAARKGSTSTIRSLASMSARPPFSPALRRNTAPLQPRLDTEDSLGNLVQFPTITSYENRQDRRGPPLTGLPRERQTSTGTGVDERNHRHRSISGSTLTGLTPASSSSQTARTASGRAPLHRSVSTASTSSLSALLRADDRPSTSSSSVTGTLKRASGVFGSIGRLAGLAGFTSLSQDNTNNKSQPSPTRTTSSGRSSTEFTAASSNAVGGGRALRPTSTLTSEGSGSTSGLRFSTTKGTGKAHYTQPSASKQAVISKFIDPADTYVPFPRSKQRSGIAIQPAQVQQQTGGGSSGSRARQKMMTQRDYPDSGDEATGRGRNPSSEEDLLSRSDQGGGSASGSRIDLQQYDRSGTSTPAVANPGAGARDARLAPGVQRWITALVKEAERIDKQHETCMRFNDIVGASFARVLERKREQEERERREALAAKQDDNSRPSSIRSKSMR